MDSCNNSSRSLSGLKLTLGCCMSLLFTAPVLADDEQSQMASTPHQASENAMHHSMPATDHSQMAMEDHSAHMKIMAASTVYKRSTHSYSIPDLEFTDADGKAVRIQQLLNQDRPVILNFIFTSCTTVCPILSATLAKASKSFKDDEMKPLMISVSIDPDYDTPERLRNYAKRYHAGNNWLFLTGTRDKTIALQRSFSAYYGTKMNHQPVTFMRSSPDQSWVRLQGFTSSASLVAEYHALFNHPG